MVVSSQNQITIFKKYINNDDDTFYEAFYFYVLAELEKTRTNLIFLY